MRDHSWRRPADGPFINYSSSDLHSGFFSCIGLMTFSWPSMLCFALTPLVYFSAFVLRFIWAASHRCQDFVWVTLHKPWIVDVALSSLTMFALCLFWLSYFISLLTSTLASLFLT